MWYVVWCKCCPPPHSPMWAPSALVGSLPTWNVGLKKVTLTCPLPNVGSTCLGWFPRVGLKTVALVCGMVQVLPPHSPMRAPSAWAGSPKWAWKPWPWSSSSTSSSPTSAQTRKMLLPLILYSQDSFRKFYFLFTVFSLCPITIK